jgi:hypothetical protein
MRGLSRSTFPSILYRYNRGASAFACPRDCSCRRVNDRLSIVSQRVFLTSRDHLRKTGRKRHVGQLLGLRRRVTKFSILAVNMHVVGPSVCPCFVALDFRSLRRRFFVRGIWRGVS